MALCKFVDCFLDCWLMWKGPAYCGWCCGSRMYKKQTEQALNYLESSPRPLLQFLLVPALCFCPSEMAHHLEDEICSFLSRLFLIVNNIKQTKTDAVWAMLGRTRPGSGSVLKRACCSCGGLRFNFQPLYGTFTTGNSSSKGCDTLFWFLWVSGMHVVYIHTPRQNTR